MLLAEPPLPGLLSDSSGLTSWAHCPYTKPFLWGLSWMMPRLSEGKTRRNLPSTNMPSLLLAPPALPGSFREPTGEHDSLVESQRSSHPVLPVVPRGPPSGPMMELNSDHT